MPMMVSKHFTTIWDPSDNFARGPVLELTGFAMAQCPVLAEKNLTNFPFNMEKLWAFVLQQTAGRGLSIYWRAWTLQTTIELQTSFSNCFLPDCIFFLLPLGKYKHF